MTRDELDAAWSTSWAAKFVSDMEEEHGVSDLHHDVVVHELASVIRRVAADERARGREEARAAASELDDALLEMSPPEQGGISPWYDPPWTPRAVAARDALRQRIGRPALEEAAEKAETEPEQSPEEMIRLTREAIDIKVAQRRAEAPRGGGGDECPITGDSVDNSTTWHCPDCERTYGPRPNDPRPNVGPARLLPYTFIAHGESVQLASSDAVDALRRMLAAAAENGSETPRIDRDPDHDLDPSDPDPPDICAACGCNTFQSNERARLGPDGEVARYWTCVRCEEEGRTADASTEGRAPTAIVTDVPWVQCPATKGAMRCVYGAGHAIGVHCDGRDRWPVSDAIAAGAEMLADAGRRRALAEAFAACERVCSDHMAQAAEPGHALERSVAYALRTQIRKLAHDAGVLADVDEMGGGGGWE